MEFEELQEVCLALPIFPLPRLVLLPGEQLPLHIFEPRYRTLLAEVMAGDGVMGMATLKPGYELVGDRDPEVFTEVGLGRVIHHQPLPDGRSNVLLESVGRARIHSELPTVQPYRIVRAELVEPSTDGVSEAVTRLRMMVLQVGALSPEASAEAHRLMELDGVEMAHSLARKLLSDPEDRRAYLAQDFTAKQVDLVCDRLARFLALNMGPTAEA